MNKYIKHIIIFFSIIVVISSCSTKKNTAIRRAYHNLTAHYNAYFNGREAFKAGKRTIEQSHTDDFTKILPLFYYEDKDALSGVSSKMDRAIKKASKVIKLHSITAKPKRKKGKLTEKEKEFYNRKEFNNWVDDSYMLMGKAFMYKADYNNALLNFNYVVSEFPNQPAKFEGLIWAAKTNIIQSNYKQAKNILDRVEGDKKLPKKLQKDLYLAYADLYIKQHKYKEAIKWLEKAVKKEQKKRYRVRYTYVLAQLYQKLNDIKNAEEYYRQVIKMKPDYAMEFNAKINRATSYDNQSGNGKEITRQLQKMLKDGKNIDFQDQIYYALANIALKDGDKEKAIEYYKLSASKSVSNNTQKALSFLKLGQLYFEKPDYQQSQMYYDSCMAFLPSDYPDYETLKKKNDILTELITNLNEVRNQDSLQLIAKLSEKERNKIIDGIIKKLREEEQRKRQEEQQRIMDNALFGQQNGNMFNNQQNAGKWYFYNPTSINMGKSEFRRKWGNRKLEDNWRRKDKTITSFEEIPEDEQTSIDSTTTKKLDPKSRDYYLKDLPLTDSLMQVSNKKIEDALYNASLIYKDKLNDYPKAIETIEELNRRFPNSEYELDSWFNAYQAASLMKDANKQNYYKNKIISKYPDSNYAKFLTNPDYLAEIEEQNKKIYTLYDKAYEAFRYRKFNQVIQYADYAENNYKNNKLLVKFKLLKALAIGGTGKVDSLKADLKHITLNYPNTSEAKTAEYILNKVTAENYKNFIPQDQPETTQVDIADNNGTPKEETAEEIIKKELYKYNPDTTHLYVIAVNKAKADVNRIKFDLTSYNVENFLMFDFQVKKLPYNDKTFLITVSKFKNAKQAQKYFKIITKRSDVFTNIKPSDYTSFIISTDNFSKLRDDKDIEKYLRFYRKSYK